MIVATKTTIDRSLSLMMLVIPVKNEAMAERADKTPGIAKYRLLKNVAPPRWPDQIKIFKIKNITTKAMINPTDHFPKVVFMFPLKPSFIFVLKIIFTKRFF